MELRATCNSLIQRFNRIFLPVVLLQTLYRSLESPEYLEEKRAPRRSNIFELFLPDFPPFSTIKAIKVHYYFDVCLLLF